MLILYVIPNVILSELLNKSLDCGSWLHRNSVFNRRNWEVWLYILIQLSIHTTDSFNADLVVWYKILCGIPEEKDWLSFFELQIMWPYSAPYIRQLWVCFHGINNYLQKYYSYFNTYFYFSGVMKGELDEVATTIQFKPDFENWTLLTVVILCFCNS